MDKSSSLPDSPNRILFYDAECSLCSKSITYIHKISKHDKELYFSGFESSAAKSLLTKNLLESQEEVVLFWEDQLFSGPIAIEFLLKKYARNSVLALLFRLSPRFLQNIVYKLVARNRDKLKIQKCVFDKDLSQRIIY